MKSFFSTVILTAFILATTITLAQEQNVWKQKYVGAPSVILYGDTLQMWYSGSTPEPIGGIGYASSVDGITWNYYAGNPIMIHQPYGGWNERTVYEPLVLYVDTLYHMWYTSADDPQLPGPCYIHHATSLDGLSWVKDTLNNPVLSPGPNGSWDQTWVDSHCIIRVDSTYHMWYAGANGTYVRIGHATSADGINWTKDKDNPVLGLGTSQSWDYPRVEGPNVIFDGQLYHMWYSGGQHSKWRIGYATSSDGRHWFKADSVNPVLTPGENGKWDDTAVGFCSVLLDTVTSTYRMWYSGLDKYLLNQTPWKLSGQTGYAISSDGINWIKHPEPVVTEIENVNHSKIPVSSILKQNYPNPFNPITNFEFRISNFMYVNLSIYNILGQKVTTLVDKKQPAGSYQVQWDASEFASGVYMYRLQAGDFVQTRKLLLLK